MTADRFDFSPYAYSWLRNDNDSLSAIQIYLEK